MEKQGMSEQLKKTDPMAWIGKMNAIRNSVMEIVNSKLIYAYLHIKKGDDIKNIISLLNCLRCYVTHLSV